MVDKKLWEPAVQSWLIPVLLGVLWSAALASPLMAAGDETRASLPGQVAKSVFPAYITSYAREDAVGFAGFSADPGNRTPSVTPTPLGASAFDVETAGGSGMSYLPVLYSALIPGAGEIAMGHYYRGAALVALEAAAWIGYASYRNKGLDGRAAFEAFADAHWDYDRWIFNHPAVESLLPGQRTFDNLDSIGQTSWAGWPGYHSYAARDDVKLNYYENIGKYDWFISGWEDWDPMSKPRDTSLRDQYRAMRKKSNDDLDTADKFIYLSIATRVYSLVETIILVRRQENDSQSGTSGHKNYSFTTRSTGLTSGEFALVYRF